MLFSWKMMLALAIVLVTFSAVPRLFAKVPSSAPDRLPDQSHNRMVYVKSEGKHDVYVNMPGHYDLGSPSISPDGKQIIYCPHKENAPPQLHVIDMRTKKSEPIGIGFYGAQWSSDGKSVYCNGLMPQLDLSLGRFPARLWIDRSKIEFFALDKDVPYSPCVSRDGKTLVLIVDSDGRAKSAEEQKKDAEAEAAEKAHPEIP